MDYKQNFRILVFNNSYNAMVTIVYKFASHWVYCITIFEQ